MSHEERHILYCVDKNNGMIYEAQEFEDYVLVRPATPLYYAYMENMTPEVFSDRFEEFYGNPEDIRKFSQGLRTPFTVD